jgi:hypothetical protein
MRTTLRPAVRSMLIFSAELVLGPGHRHVSGHSELYVRLLLHTNGADDAGAAECLGRLVLRVQVREPFHARLAIFLMGEGVRHCVFEGGCAVEGQEMWNGRCCAGGRGG